VAPASVPAKSDAAGTQDCATASYFDEARRGTACECERLKLPHAAEAFEGALVAPQPPLLRLPERELDVDPAAVRQDQDEEAQGAPGAVDLDGAEAAPVDLGALAGGEAQREAGLSIRRTDAAHVVLHDQVAAAVALFAQLVEELRGLERMRLQPARQGGLEGVQFVRARALCGGIALETLAGEPAPHGLDVQVHLPGDLRRGAALLAELFEPAERVVVDHGTTSSPRT